MNGRRHFMQSLLGILSSLPLSLHPASAQTGTADRLGKLMPQRKLGKSGTSVTQLAMGGYHFGKIREKEAQAMLETALENGLRFFDNAVQYQDGGAERRMGKLVTPKYRDVIFLMTKSTAKTGKDAQKELEDSLRRLNTDYLDLWQIHSIESPEDVDARIENGVLDVFLKAQEQKRVRHIGFTGHTTYKAHLRMLERTQDTQPFETCQMPINILDPSYESFILNVVPKLVERKIGVLAMKTLAFGNLLKDMEPGGRVIPDRLSVREAIQFVWSLPVSALITGAESAGQIKEKIEWSKSLVEWDDARRTALIEKVADLAGKKREWYKA